MYPRAGARLLLLGAKMKQGLLPSDICNVAGIEPRCCRHNGTPYIVLSALISSALEYGLFPSGTTSFSKWSGGGGMSRHLRPPMQVIGYCDLL